MFQDLSPRLIKPFFGGFETRLKFMKSGLCSFNYFNWGLGYSKKVFRLQ